MKRVHSEVSEFAKVLGYEYAGVSGAGRLKFFHPVTKKTIFCNKSPDTISIYHAKGDLRRGAGAHNRGKEAVPCEKKRPKRKLGLFEKPSDKSYQVSLEKARADTDAELLAEKLPALFAEADKRHLSPEQTVSFAHAYVRTALKLFRVTEKEVRDAYDASRGSFLHRALLPALQRSARGGWHRLT